MTDTDTPLEEQPFSMLISQLKKVGVTDEVIEKIGDDKKKLARTAREAMDISDSYGPSDQTEEKVILVIGECGDGKTTLVNALRDMNFGDGLGKTGRAAGGVTKEIVEYVGKDINGQKIRILDSPGIGDQKVKPPELVSKISQVLGDQTIDGVIVTTKITDGRCKLGAQVVQRLVEEAMISDPSTTGHDKWQNIILAGTQRDVAMSPDFIEEDERTPIEHFVLDKGVVDEYGDPEGTVANFFRSAPSGWGSYALVEKNDYSELEAAIANLPSIPIRYRVLSPEEMSQLLAKVMGWDASELQAEFEKWKADHEEQQAAKLAEMKAEIEAEHKKQLEEADAAQKAALEKMEVERKAEAERVAAQITEIEKARKTADTAAAQQVKKLRADNNAKIEKLEKLHKAAEAKSKDEVEAFKKQFEREKAKFEAEFERKRRDAESERNQAQLTLQNLNALKDQLECMPYDGNRNYTPHRGGGRTCGPQGQPIQTGPQGGRFYINKNGNKTYVKG